MGRHSELRTEILRTLPLWRVKGTSLRINAWYVNTGASRYTPKARVKVTATGQRIEVPGKERFIRFGRPGTSDTIGMIPPNARWLAIEVKVWPDKPTPAQKAFLQEVRDWGGIGIVAYRVSDVRAELLKEGLIE